MIYSDADLTAPLRLQPDNFTDNQWGGDWIPAMKGLSAPASPVGEAWEFSAHRHRPSSVTVAGRAVPLPDLLAAQPRAVYGERLAAKLGGAAPFLLKFIDSRDDLSVQVHPDDVYARRRENDIGKAESWIILGTSGAPDEGYLYLGFDPRRRDDFADGTAFAEAFLGMLDQANGQGPSEDPAVRAKAERLILPFLNRVAVKPGDVYDLPPGTVHAIGRGVRLFEIQQSSDVTYRVWDWNRPDAKQLALGRRAFRPLHLDRAKDVLDFSARPAGDYRRAPSPERIEGTGAIERWLLLEETNGRFAVERITVGPGARAVLPAGFSVITVVSGTARLACGGKPWGGLAAGHSALVPAASATVEVSGDHDLNRGQDMRLGGGAVALFRSFVPV